MLNKTNIELMKIKTALRLSKEVLQDKSKDKLHYYGIPIIECPYLDEDEAMVIFKNTLWDLFEINNNDIKEVMGTIDSVLTEDANKDRSEGFLKISRILVTPDVERRLRLYFLFMMES
jgi:hypothetical protein